MFDQTVYFKFEQILKLYCNPLYERLLPPLNEDEIKTYFNSWNINDDSLIELFKLAGGIEYDENLPTHSFDYTGFGVIPSLKYIDELISINKSYKSWNDLMFPLVASFSGDFLLYQSDKKSDDYGKLFLFSPNLGHVNFLVSYFDSIESFFTTITVCFENKIFKYDYAEMLLEIDYTESFKISKIYNPLSKYWNIH